MTNIIFRHGQNNFNKLFCQIKNIKPLRFKNKDLTVTITKKCGITLIIQLTD